MNRRQFLVLASASAVAAGTKASAQADVAAAPLISFGLLTDVQYADADPQGERHYRESIPKLQAAVADLAKEQLPLTIHLGDVIDRDFASFAVVLPLFQALGGPVRYLLGNHDYNVRDAEKGRVVATLGMPHDYYSFSNSGVKFVMLDTTDVSTYKYPQGSAAAVAAAAVIKQHAAGNPHNAQPSSGGISPAQLAWLEKELAAADAAHQPVVVCGHHPLVPESGHQASNSREILAVLAGHRCVRAYCCGHNHAGGQVLVNGVPFITFKSILHHPQVTSYAVVRLFTDRLVIEGRGREQSRVIPLAAMAP